MQPSKEALTGTVSSGEVQPKKRVTFDLGSSTLKAVFDVLHEEIFNDHHYTPDIITAQTFPGVHLGENGRFKVVWGEEIHKIEAFIEANVSADVEELDITSAKKPLYAYRKQADGTFTKILFYDEPTLTDALTPEEDRLIKDRLHLTKPIDGNNPLLKILALQKNPALVQCLFGADATFSDLHFGSLATFIRQVVTKEDFPKVGLHYTLAFGMNGCSPADVVSLVEALGLGQQLNFETEKMVTIRDVAITEKDDFTVEASAIVKREQVVLAQNEKRLYLGADSVGKEMMMANDIKKGSDWGAFDALKTIKYRTQRTMGNANNWLRPLAEKLCESGEDKPVYVINSVLAEAEPSDEWFFDPNANKGDGGLFHKAGIGYLEVKREELTESKYLMDFDKIMTAVAWGAVSAMRDLLPTEDMMDYDAIAIYGGLVADYDYGPNDGWRRVFRAVMPTDKRIELLGIPNAGVAMSLVHTIENGGYVDLETAMPIGPISGDEDDTNGQGIYYDAWKHWQEQYTERILAPALLGYTLLPWAV